MMPRMPFGSERGLHYGGYVPDHRRVPTRLPFANDEQAVQQFQVLAVEHAELHEPVVLYATPPALSEHRFLGRCHEHYGTEVSLRASTY